MATVTKENLTDLTALLKINVSKEDYQPQIEKTFKDYAKKAQIKGFRPGKVPTGVIRKMYGEQILAEELNKIVSKELNSYLEENKIDILGQPLPKENRDIQLNVHQSKDYEFEYELGLAPDFDIKLLKNSPKITQYEIKIDDHIINEEIEKLRKEHGEVSHPDVVADEDVVVVKVQELDKSGVKEGGIENQTAFAIDQLTKKAKAEFIGKKKGETIEVKIFKLMDKEKEDIAKHLLGVSDKAEIKNLGEKFQVTIEKINRVEKEELGPKLFDKMYGEGKVKSVEEFKEKFKKDFKKFADNQSENQLHNDIFEKLMSETKVPLPDGFLKKWIKASNEKPITDVEIEKEYDRFAEDLKKTLIINKISKEHDIKVEEEELKAQTRETIKSYFGQGGQEPPEEQVEMLVGQMLQNKEHVQKTYDYLLSEKLFNFLKTKFNIKPKSISLKDFYKLKNK